MAENNRDREQRVDKKSPDAFFENLKIIAQRQPRAGQGNPLGEWEIKPLPIRLCSVWDVKTFPREEKNEELKYYFSEYYPWLADVEQAKKRYAEWLQGMGKISMVWLGARGGKTLAAKQVLSKQIRELEKELWSLELGSIEFEEKRQEINTLKEMYRELYDEKYSKKA